MSETQPATTASAATAGTRGSGTTTAAPTTTAPKPTPSSTAAAPSSGKPTASRPPPRKRKEWDIMLDSWYFNEINKRHNSICELFKNYQINPYNKATLQFITPKPNERRPPLPKEDEKDKSKIDCSNTFTRLVQGDKSSSGPTRTEEEQKLLESYKIVKGQMDKCIKTPKQKYCEPETELMRLGWFPPLAPAPQPKTCMYILTPWAKDSQPCCYYYPTPPSELQQNENYDERFRATHQTAEFIKTQTKLRKFDEIMNPNGYRGQVKTTRVKPGGKSKNKQ